jgi:hypothetical protein
MAGFLWREIPPFLLKTISKIPHTYFLRSRQPYEQKGGIVLSQDHFARHGGVHFSLLGSEEELNRFVRELPEEKRESLFTVMKELEKAGLIRIHNDGVFADGEGNIGGSSEC